MNSSTTSISATQSTFAVTGLEGRSSSLFATVPGKDGAKGIQSPKVSVGQTGTGPVRLVLPK